MVSAWGDEGISRELLVGFDPVALFIEQLESRFGHLGLFFADFYGGEVIAAKWDPEVLSTCLSWLIGSDLRTILSSDGRWGIGQRQNSPGESSAFQCRSVSLGVILPLRTHAIYAEGIL